MSEKDIENRVNNRVKIWDILCEKVKFAEAGYPDRLYVIPNGIQAWIEFKKPGEEPHPLQAYRLEELNERGCYAGWTDDCDTAVIFLQTLMESKRISEKGYPTTIIADCRGFVSRPGTRENFSLSSYLQNLKEAGFRIVDAYSRPITPDVQGLAR